MNSESKLTFAICVNYSSAVAQSSVTAWIAATIEVIQIGILAKL